MRRFLMVCLSIVLALPKIGFAQDEPLVWDLSSDNFVDVEDLGFRFYYPIDWKYAITDQIVIAEDQADIDALTDDDDSTQAEGIAITINALPFSTLAEVAENPTLDGYVEFLIEDARISEAEQSEVPIMARRSITISGQNATGRFNMLSVWQQHDNFVAITISVPDEQTLIDIAYTWEVILSSIEPLNALELSEDVLTAQEAGFTVQYPAGWFITPYTTSIVYELQEDIEKAPASGMVVSVDDRSLENVELEDGATATDLAVANLQRHVLSEPLDMSEYIILDQPAITFKAEDASGMGRWALVTQVIIDGRAVSIIASAWSRESLDAFEPTWIAMLQSITPIEA